MIYNLSVDEYRKALERQFGSADPSDIKRYAEKRMNNKRKTFNIFTNDPNCKTCGKKDN